MRKYKYAPAIPALPLAILGPQALADTASGAVQTLHVTKSTDDGSEGTFRWALETNNTDPGHYRIEIDPAGAQAAVIAVASELPHVLGPVQITYPQHDVDGTFAAIDGSGYVGPAAKDCPGAFGANVRTTTKPGLVLQDTHGVEISGLDIRNFCIGILINRASNDVIRDSRITGNHGGAGIMITGDDGKGNSTATTTNNNKILRNTCSTTATAWK